MAADEVVDVPKLVDIRDGVAVYDERQARKQPDWTYAPIVNRPLRLVTFNIKNGLGKDGVVDNDRLAEVCDGLHADVLALQEVDSGAERSGLANQAAVIAKKCGLSYFYAPAFELKAGGRYGNALLARGEIDTREVLELPVAPDRQARVAALARVTIEDVALSVGGDPSPEPPGWRAADLRGRRGAARAAESRGRVA